MTRRLLVIDPDPDLPPGLDALLRARGIELVVVPEGSFDEIRRLKPEWVSLGWTLSRGTGSGVCSRIKRDAELAETFVILMAAETEVLRAHSESSRHPADAYLPKPVDAQHMLRILPDLPDPNESLDLALVPESGDIAAPSIGGTGWAASEFQRRARELSTSREAASPSRGSPAEKLNWLRQHVRDLEEQRRGLLELVEDMLTAGAGLESRLASVVSERDGLRAEADRQNQRQAAELERLRREFEGYEGKAHGQIATLEQQGRHLREQLGQAQGRLESEQRSRADDQKRLEIMEGELEELDTRLSELQAHAAREREENEIKIAALHDQVRASDQLVDDMQAEVLAARRELASHRKSAELDTSQVELDRLKESHERLATILEEGLKADE